MLPIRTILLPTDFSDCSEYARRLACSLCLDYGARLVVVHVAPREIVYSGLIGGPDETRYDMSDLEAQLSQVFQKERDTHPEVHVREGDPVAAILEMASESDADLIVMGTTGRSGLDRLILGSVAEAVIRKAHCPVLTVRGPGTIADEQVPSLAGAEA